MKSTYTLDIIIKTICRDDKEVDAVHSALKLALHEYQWQYQNASSKQFRDVSKSTSNAINITIKHLTDCGFDQLAEDIVTALEDDGSTLIKSKFITSAKQIMRRHLLPHIGKSRYSRDFATLMISTFTEYCEEHPLPYAPGHIEGDFQEQKKREEHEDRLNMYLCDHSRGK